jgi:outer membrane protein assembly factor BamB
MRRALYAAGALACLLAGPASQTAQAEPAWTTYHRDAQRSGDDPDATQPLAPALAWQTVDLGAPIWSQPLIVGDRAYVATVGDEAYALDTSTGKVVWERSVGIPVPASELPCGDVEPTVGVVGTPVIDLEMGTFYMVADRWNAITEEAHHVLVGLDMASGEEVLSTPVDPPGADPKALLQRTALNIDGGDVIFGFGGNNGDCGDYRGTVVAVPESGGQARFWQYQPAPPSSSGGAVWATGGPAVDRSGNVYASTGNPNPPAGTEATTFDYSDSVVKLNPSLDFVLDPTSELAAPLAGFQPPTWQSESNTDTDLGSAAPELLPGGLLFQAGKSGTGYLIDETEMSSVFSAPVCRDNPGFSGSFGGDAFADGVIYIPCENGTQALAYDQQAQTFTPLWQSEAQDAVGPPIVSAGLVWTVATGRFKGGGSTLYGLDPATGKPRYMVTMPTPVIDHFASPSAAGGRLLVATGTCVTAYQVAQLAAGETGSGRAGTCGTAGKPPEEPPASAGPSQNSKPSDPSAAPTGVEKPSRQPFAVVLHGTRLHLNSKGIVRVALRCTTPAKPCRGRITLRAKLFTAAPGGKHPLPYSLTVTLARKIFGPVRGSFSVRLHLNRRALARLHPRKGVLRVALGISLPGDVASQFIVVLTR